MSHTWRTYRFVWLEGRFVHAQKKWGFKNISNKITSIKGEKKRRWSIRKRLKLRMKRKKTETEDETENEPHWKKENKQTTTTTTTTTTTATKHNYTLRMQKIMCITCEIVLRVNQFSILIGKSSPVFSFSFFSPAMQSGIKISTFNNKFLVVEQQH